jgi:hypothetical protein
MLALRPAMTPVLLRTEVNGLTGVIPDNFDATSHLRVLTAWGNGLTGSLPSTLGLVPNMEVRVYRVREGLGVKSMLGTCRSQPYGPSAWSWLIFTPPPKLRLWHTQ